MSVLSHSDTELGPSLGSPLSPIKSPKAAEPGSCQPGSVAELGLSLEYSGEQEHMLPPSGSGIFMGYHIICILCSRKVIYSLIIMTYS